MTQTMRKKFIVEKFDIIKKYVNYSKLLQSAKEMNILSSEMIQNIECAPEPDINLKYNKLLNHLIDVGLYAFKDLVLETVPNTNLRLVEEQFIEMLSMYDKTDPLEEFDEKLIKYPNTELNVIKSTKFHQSHTTALQIYSMESSTRGILFLVNNINYKSPEYSKRSGAQYDKFYLISLYRGMGFKIYYFENLTANNFRSFVNELIAHYLDETDCLVMAILTHGEKSQPVFYDGEKIAIENILNCFSDTYCPVLKGKPKIFLFPFCRGNSPDIGVKFIRISQIEPDSSRGKISWGDIIICYGTVAGYQTLRSSVEGSWFVKEFCKIIAEKAHENDFETMLYDVKESIMKLRPGSPNSPVSDNENYLQTPSVVTIDFNKILYFNPGYCVNNNDKKLRGYLNQKNMTI